MHLVENNILIPEMGRLLRGGQQVVFTPGGVSMRPFIEGGKDSVTLEYPAPDTIRVGDILLCRIGERYVLHRLIGIEGARLEDVRAGNQGGAALSGLIRQAGIEGFMRLRELQAGLTK